MTERDSTAAPSDDLDHISRQLRSLAMGALPVPGRAEKWQDQEDAAGVRHVALYRLARELRRGGDSLAGVGLLTEFPPAQLMPDRESDEDDLRRLNRARLIRDVLVFFPILITWTQLAILTGTGGGDSGSWFERWQHGGDWLAWNFQTTAWVVAGVIALIVLQSYRVHKLHTRLEGHGSIEQHRVLAADLLAQATLCLARLPRASEGPVPSGRHLAGLAKAVGDGVRELNDAVRTIGPEIGKSLRSGLGQDLERGIGTWTQTAADLRNAISALAAPAEAMSRFADLRAEMLVEERKLHEELRLLAQRMKEAAKDADVSRQVAGEIAEAMTALDQAMQSFQTRTESLGDFIRQIRVILQELEGRVWGIDGAPVSGYSPRDQPPPAGAFSSGDNLS